MKLAGASSDDRNKIIAIALFILIGCGVAYYEVFGGSTPAPATPAAPVVTTVPVAATGGSATVAVAGVGAKKADLTTATLDPTLHMDAMLVSESVEYSGSGRNIFSASSAPPPKTIVIPNPIATPRPLLMQQPVIAAPQGPPPPPPIELKFFGTETSPDGTRHAFLLHGDDVIIAAAGDVVVRRYRVVTIAASSIEVEDLQYNDKQTLPLLKN